MPRPKPDKPGRRFRLVLPADAADALDRLAARHPNEREQPSPSNAVAWLVREEELREAVERVKQREKE